MGSINLDNTPRPAVTLEIAGQSFTIRRVVTGAQQLWLMYAKESIAYIEKIDVYQKAAEKTKGQKELAKLTEDISREIDGFAEHKIDRLLDILELLLTKNGYAFDRQWWIDNADEADYREFIVESMTKDRRGGTKKKDEAVKSDGTA